MTSHQPVLIRNIEVFLSRAELYAPYVLSFTTLDAFESVAVAVERDNGVIGIGEAVALPGYGSETTADVISMVRKLIDGAAGRPATDLLRRCRDAWREAPLAESAVQPPSSSRIGSGTPIGAVGFPLIVPSRAKAARRS